MQWNLNKVRKKDTLDDEGNHQDDEEDEKVNHHWIVHILHRWLEHVPSTHHSGSRDDSKIGQDEEILAQSIILPVPRCRKTLAVYLLVLVISSFNNILKCFELEIT